eukprot:TRINITY_DN4155_c0_g1_i1.p1 TRINITY_DN4155_c0_g1~~TRINITY_DN4155_c0_g1_i1.p1  ORF type:complete len:612 (-),score=173.91 TRINITY_DN4155_c0_g1_i1:37-1872(-)
MDKSMSKQVEKEKRVAQEEAARMQRLNKKLNRQLVEALSQRDSVEYSIQDIKDEHTKDVEQMQHECVALQEKIKQMAGKLEKLPLVERYIIDMFMEFRDTLPFEGDINSEEAQRHIERERLQLRSQSALVTLDYLRNNIRAMLASREDQEALLHRDMQRKLLEKDAALQETREELDQLRQRMTQVQQQAEIAAHAKSSLEQDSVSMRAKFDTQINELKRENRELQTTLVKRDREIEQLKQTLEKRDEILLAKETRLVHVTQLEQQIARDQSQHRRERNNLKAQSMLQQKQLDEEAKVFAQVQVANAQLKQQLKDLQAKLHEAVVAANRSNVLDNERRAQRAEEQVEQLQKQVGQAETQLREARDRITVLEVQNERMRDEYTRIFAAAQRDQERRAAEDDAMLRKHSRQQYRGDDSNFTTQKLREKLEEKERECQQLLRRLRKLVLHEHRDQKYYELEKSNLLEELDDLQKTNEQLGGRPGKILNIDRKQFHVPGRGNSLILDSGSKSRTRSVRAEGSSGQLSPTKSVANLTATSGSAAGQGPASPGKNTTAISSLNDTDVSFGSFLGGPSASPKTHGTNTGTVRLTSDVRKKLPLGSLGASHNSFVPASLL